MDANLHERAQPTRDTQTVQKISPPIFRFKLDDTIVSLISYFSETHMMDDRKKYKSEWKLYYEKHYEIFSREIQRLIDLGYNNKEPIEDKMFKAGRYYFRKKNLNLNKKEKKEEEEGEKQEKENVKKKITIRKKIRMDRNILNSFDNHIGLMYSTSEIVSPEKSFENYCKTTIVEITSEIMNIYNNHNLSVSEINAKLKETYRIRYFNIIRKNS